MRNGVPGIDPGECLEGLMASSCRIAIVGGGLAGIAAAHALKTVGIKAEGFETAPAHALRPGGRRGGFFGPAPAGGEMGAALNVSPKAVKALQAIGVGDNVAA